MVAPSAPGRGSAGSLPRGFSQRDDRNALRQPPVSLFSWFQFGWFQFGWFQLRWDGATNLSLFGWSAGTAAGPARGELVGTVCLGAAAVGPLPR